MKIIRSTLLGLAGAALTAGAITAASHEAETPASVNARQAQMELYAFNIGILGSMAKGAAEYNADAAKSAASNIVKLGSLDPGAMWVPGTTSDDYAASRALPALWENFDDVITKAVAMDEAALAMEAAAGESLEALQGAMAALGASCGGCHKSYRAPE